MSENRSDASAARGHLVALEGVDGCGKSTQAALLAQRLGAVLTFEPGATALGASLRRVLLGTERPTLDARAEALLMAADRAEHVTEVIEPALARGAWVVTDRFSASTFAYQGYGRGLDLAELAPIVAWAARSLEADVNVLLDVPVEVAVGRRGHATTDRFEAEGPEFVRRVAEGFRELAAGAPDRWLVVDGTRSPADVAAEVWAGVETMCRPVSG